MFYTKGGSRPEGLEAPMELIRLKGIRRTQSTGSRGEVTDLCLGINQYSVCSDKSSQLQWPTGPHTLAHKTVLVRHVKTAKHYHCNESKHRDSKSLALADWRMWEIFKRRGWLCLSQLRFEYHWISGRNPHQNEHYYDFWLHFQVDLSTISIHSRFFNSTKDKSNHKS